MGADNAFEGSLGRQYQLKRAAEQLRLRTQSQQLWLLNPRPLAILSSVFSTTVVAAAGIAAGCLFVFSVYAFLTWALS